MVEDEAHEQQNAATEVIKVPESIDLEPTQVAFDKHLRVKAESLTNQQTELRRIYRPQLNRKKLRNAKHNNVLFKTPPSAPSGGELVERTINDLPPRIAVAPEDDTRLTPAERLFRGMFKTVDFNYEDLLPWRLRTAYRLVREMARLRGMIGDGDLLSDIQTDYDPWIQPTKFDPNRIPKDTSQSFEVFQIFLEAEMLGKDWQYSRPSYKPGVDRFTFPGIALLPPPVPDKFINKQCEVTEDYDPYEDKALILYIEALESVAKYLKIEGGCELDPQLGSLGLRGLYDPELIRLIFPTRTQLMAWEEILIDEATEKLIDLGTLGVQKYLKRSHGYLKHEIAHVTKAAKVMITRRNEFDPEEERALMALRVEDYIRRARSALDLKAEAFGLKQLSLINGLGKTDPEDANNDMFFQVAKRVTSMRESLTGGQQKSLK